MIDFEDFDYKNIVNKNGLSYFEFRKKLTPNYKIVWRDIILGYILLIFTIFGFLYIEYTIALSNLIFIFLSILTAILAAFWLSFIQLFIHEAAHYNIHPDKRKNDFLANLFIGLILGIHIKGYRKTHWKHHLRLGKPDDTENSYFHPLSILYFLKMITGIHALTILLNRNKIKNNQDKDSINKQKINFVLGGMLNLTILILFYINGLYFSCLTWILTVIVFYPLLATIRQVLEHRSEKFTGKKITFFDKEHGKVNRIFKPSFFSFFFGGAGFDRHLLHHFNPQISYTNLKEVESFLNETVQFKTIIEQSKTTYFRTLLSLIEI